MAQSFSSRAATLPGGAEEGDGAEIEQVLGYSLSYRHDPPKAVGTGYERSGKLRIVVTLDHQQITIVERGGLESQLNLPRTRRSLRNLRKFKILQSPTVFDLPGLHGTPNCFDAAFRLLPVGRRD